MLRRLLILALLLCGCPDTLPDGRCDNQRGDDIAECCEDLGEVDCGDGLLPSIPHEDYACAVNYCGAYVESGCIGLDPALDQYGQCV